MKKLFLKQRSQIKLTGSKIEKIYLSMVDSRTIARDLAIQVEKYRSSPTKKDQRVNLQELAKLALIGLVLIEEDTPTP